jgi:hypothetical protein
MLLTEFKVGISPKYILPLSKFVAKNDIRYYLNGINVKPHPVKGVILTATDGSSLLTIYDKDGFCDRDYILPLSRQLVAASRKPKAWPKSVLFDGDRILVTSHALDDFCEVELNAYIVIHCEYVKEIDGKYPDVGGALTNKGLKPANSFQFNVAFLEKLKFCTDTPKHPAAKFYNLGKNQPTIAISGLDQQYLMCVMPMRDDRADEVLTMPDHGAFLIEQSEEAKQRKKAA